MPWSLLCAPIYKNLSSCGYEIGAINDQEYIFLFCCGVEKGFIVMFPPLPYLSILFSTFNNVHGGRKEGVVKWRTNIEFICA
jgi:hypothetical protein